MKGKKMRIESKDLIATLEKWKGDSSTYAGLKEPALLQKVIDEVQHMATNEEIRQRIKRAEIAETKLTATDLISAAKDEFCNKFCRYTEECWQELDDEELRECPLDIL